VSSTAPYRTIIVGKLVQDSALAVGGNGQGFADAPLARDGQGRVVLRGTTLAGALVATARCVFGEVSPRISGEAGGDSVWRVLDAHPIGDARPPVELRQSVGLRQKTGAAARGALHDLEVIPRGCAWRLCLEVDTSREPGAAGVAAAALDEWALGRCWLGRDVARGLGWLTAKDLQAVTLDAGAVNRWPRSDREPLAIVDELLKEQRKEGKDGPATFEGLRCPPAKPTRVYVSYTVKIAVGEPGEDQWGLDALCVGGQTATSASKEDWSGRLLHPQGLGAAKSLAAFDPDATFALTRPVGQERAEPLLPGGGLRGALRSSLSGLARARGDEVRDPNVERPEDEPKNPIERLFGTLKRSARLLVRDAHLVAPAEWTAAWLQHHAEDEFTQGVFESSKFDRVALVKGTFETTLVIEADPEEKSASAAVLSEAVDGDENTACWREKSASAAVLSEALEPALQLARLGHLPLGAGRWRGLGWARWTVRSRTEPAGAGADARPRDHEAAVPLPAEASAEQPVGLPSASRPAVPAPRLAPQAPRPERRRTGAPSRDAAPSTSATAVTLWRSSGASPHVPWQKREGTPPAVSWLEPSVALGVERAPSLTLAVDAWPDPVVALDEVRLSWSDRWLHALRSGDGWRWVWWRLARHADSDQAHELRVRRSRLQTRQDLARFGLTGGDWPVLWAVEYLDGRTLVTWRLESPPSAAGESS
jgi:CRISPR/Cas system CSM-associated protein Csm3 (group 7 of RAMP superfamily)